MRAPLIACGRPDSRRKRCAACVRGAPINSPIQRSRSDAVLKDRTCKVGRSIHNPLARRDLTQKHCPTIVRPVRGMSRGRGEGSSLTESCEPVRDGTYFRHGAASGTRCPS